MEISDLLSLGVQTQAVLASGYAAQTLGLRGLRGKSSASDVAFATLAFGLPTMAALAAGANCGWSLWLSVPVGFVAAYIAAGLWRAIGRRVVSGLVHALNITWSSDHQSAWEWVLDNDGMKVSELVVERADGTLLFFSGNPQSDRALARPPIHLGADGGIAMRVMKARYPSEEDWTDEIAAATNPAGDNMTYIPPTEVKRIDIRYSKRA